MRPRWNGSIQSANTPSFDKVGMNRDDFGLYRAMVISVLYSDDPKNISKNSTNPEVLYECIILGGNASGQVLSNCRLAQYFNYSERVLTASTKKVSKDKLSEHDGDIVWIQFIQGHDAYPIILSLAKSLKDASAAKIADGPRLLEIYNGLIRNINKDGELTTTMNGGSIEKGKFIAGKESIIKEAWTKTETQVTTFKSGLVVTLDGKNDKVLIKTSGGVESLVDGKGNKISIKAGSTEIIIDGASGKISLKGDMVELGSSVSDFVTKFTELASAFATHTHMVPQAPAGTLPSAPPMAPLLTTVGSQTVKVQS
jgi:aspartate 1-decarboxylase